MKEMSFGGSILKQELNGPVMIKLPAFYYFLREKQKLLQIIEFHGYGKNEPQCS